jgi:hypothetical protein
VRFVDSAIGPECVQDASSFRRIAGTGCHLVLVGREEDRCRRQFGCVVDSEVELEPDRLCRGGREREGAVGTQTRRETVPGSAVSLRQANSEEKPAIYLS